MEFVYMVEFTSQAAHNFALADFLDHIRLASGVDDDAAQRSLNASVVLFENWTGRLLRLTTVLQTSDNHTPPFRAMYGPVIDATTTVNKIDRSVTPSVTTDVTTSFYVAKDTHTYLQKLPRASVSYLRCGWEWQYDAGSTSYPAAITMAVFGIGALLYENRELANSITLEKVPVAYRTIIETYRNGDL
jgi:uncharacterized phiE125 gp8 family phage protein|tara:strand:+ start:5072 stop:5635 length:564 start_codon:yes stop_codon:yes gene_type:complete